MIEPSPHLSEKKEFGRVFFSAFEQLPLHTKKQIAREPERQAANPAFWQCIRKSELELQKKNAGFSIPAYYIDVLTHILPCCEFIAHHRSEEYGSLLGDMKLSLGKTNAINVRRIESLIFSGDFIQFCDNLRNLLSMAVSKLSTHTVSSDLGQFFQDMSNFHFAFEKDHEQLTRLRFQWGSHYFNH